MRKLYCRSQTLRPMVALRPSRKARERPLAVPRWLRSAVWQQQPVPDVSAAPPPAPRNSATAVCADLRGGGCAGPANRPGGAWRCRAGRRGPCVAGVEADCRAQPGGVAVLRRADHGARPAACGPRHGRTRLNSRWWKTSRKRASVGSAWLRARSRTYSVKCSGIGPCGPDQTEEAHAQARARAPAQIQSEPALPARKSSSGS
jgi:hypothetical protein